MKVTKITHNTTKTVSDTTAEAVRQWVELCLLQIEQSKNQQIEVNDKREEHA